MTYNHFRDNKNSFSFIQYFPKRSMPRSSSPIKTPRGSRQVWCRSSCHYVRLTSSAARLVLPNLTSMGTSQRTRQLPNYLSRCRELSHSVWWKLALDLTHCHGLTASASDFVRRKLNTLTVCVHWVRWDSFGRELFAGDDPLPMDFLLTVLDTEEESGLLLGTRMYPVFSHRYLCFEE